MPKIAVIGSRNYIEFDAFSYRMDYLLHNIKEEIEIVSGGARGVDTMARIYAEYKGYKITEFLPEYDKFPPKVAPLKRNHQIVEYADMLVAFTTGSNGTAYTIKLAEKKGIPIRIITI